MSARRFCRRAVGAGRLTKKDLKALAIAMMLKERLTVFINAPLDTLSPKERTEHERMTRELEQSFVWHRPRVEAMLERLPLTEERRRTARCVLLTIPFRT